MIDLLRHLLVVTALLVSLAGHGATMAESRQPYGAAASLHAAGMHHGAAAECDSAQSCLPEGQLESCCALGHCLVGLMAESVSPIVSFGSDCPVPGYDTAEFAALRSNLERPPRFS